jgi:hypothetical protein
VKSIGGKADFVLFFIKSALLLKSFKLILDLRITKMHTAKIQSSIKRVFHSSLCVLTRLSVSGLFEKQYVISYEFAVPGCC